MIKQSLYKMYRLVPPGVRKSVGKLGIVTSFKRLWFEADTSFHDDFYTAEYYERDVAGAAEHAAPFVRDHVLRTFAPGSVLDAGCGTGDILKAFTDAGVEGHGAELAAAGLEICRAKGLDVVQVDLAHCDRLPWEVDLVYSFEVAEHIGESAAGRYVGALTTAARREVLMTAAAPGQAGLCHVNCQPKSYWIELFRARGFAYDAEATDLWERENRRNGLADWFYKNLMVFRRASA